MELCITFPSPGESSLSPSHGTVQIAQIVSWHNVIGLKGALGIISMVGEKSATETLFWGGYWACDATGLSSNIRGVFWLLRRIGERERERGREKSLNVCVLFFSPPVKDEKRHAVKKKRCFWLFRFIFLPISLSVFWLFSRDAGRNCILIMFC